MKSNVAPVLSGNDEMIEAEMLSPRIREGRQIVQETVVTRSLPKAVAVLEKRMINEALTRNNWNKTRAAEELEISRRNLIRLVQKYELEA